jgi:hypothetical protein
MSELRARTYEDSAAEQADQDKGDKPCDYDLAGGTYVDPEPGMVKIINERFPDPDDNIQELIMKSFELAGVIKPAAETTKPLEHTGLMPVRTKKGTPRYLTEGEEDSDFRRKRDLQLLDEFITEDASRNQLALRVRQAIHNRRAFTSEELDELWGFGKKLTRGGHDLPPSLRIITVMTGIGKPENEDVPRFTGTPDDTRDIAPDVIMMLLREKE